jgi:hypothetical protein
LEFSGRLSKLKRPDEKNPLSITDRGFLEIIV